ncbi:MULTISPECIES: hypothetical protein [Haloarcula]|nr:hypothetical protein [Halomicroarcula sp. XH51]
MGETYHSYVDRAWIEAETGGTYREQGDAGLDFDTVSKTVYLNY